LVGLQEELRSPIGFTSRGFTSRPKAGGEVRISGFYNNKQTNKQTIQRVPHTPLNVVLHFPRSGVHPHPHPRYISPTTHSSQFTYTFNELPKRKKTENSNPNGFEMIDPQARVPNYSFQ